MEVWEAIRNRRSIRAFKPDPIPQDLLKRLVSEAAVWAPTGGNAQTWRFVIVTDLELTRRIKMVSPGLLGNPPAVVAICQDLDEAEKKGSELGRNVVTVMDTAMAAQNIMLAAFAEGVGSCPILSFHAGAVQQILSLPPGVVPQLLISLGFPQTKVKGPERNLKVVWFNEYS